MLLTESRNFEWHLGLLAKIKSVKFIFDFDFLMPFVVHKSFSTYILDLFLIATDTMIAIYFTHIFCYYL